MLSLLSLLFWSSCHCDDIHYYNVYWCCHVYCYYYSIVAIYTWFVCKQPPRINRIVLSTYSAAMKSFHSRPTTSSIRYPNNWRQYENRCFNTWKGAASFIVNIQQLHEIIHTESDTNTRHETLTSQKILFAVSTVGGFSFKLYTTIGNSIPPLLDCDKYQNVVEYVQIGERGIWRGKKRRGIAGKGRSPWLPRDVLHSTTYYAVPGTTRWRRTSKANYTSHTQKLERGMKRNETK